MNILNYFGSIPLMVLIYMLGEKISRYIVKDKFEKEQKFYVINLIISLGIILLAMILFSDGMRFQNNKIYVGILGGCSVSFIMIAINWKKIDEMTKIIILLLIILSIIFYYMKK